MEPEKSDATATGGPLQADDVMTTEVITVGPDEPARNVARLLLDKGIGAVPVVNGDGTPLGMVSDGDLIGREEHERLSRHDWWLAVMAGTQPLDRDFVARLDTPGRSAADVMSTPLVTVTRQTKISDIARLLATYHIKRVPVLSDGRIIGIVSRTDLLGVVAAGQNLGAAPPKVVKGGFLADMFGQGRHPVPVLSEIVPDSPAAAEKPKHDQLTVKDFCLLEADFNADEVHHKDDLRRTAAEHRRQRTKELIDTHVSDEVWHGLMHHARQAAENGEKEDMILLFPNQLCLDGGRLINIADPEWPSTLRGEAAELYLRWERDLKPTGFKLSAHVLDFPDGKPGNIGLFLVWGE